VLVGSSEKEIIKNTEYFLTGNRGIVKKALFGDGRASERIVKFLIDETS